MKKFASVMVALAVLATLGSVYAEDKKAPDTLVYETKNGPVTFPHAKHVEAVKGDCKACHDALFGQTKGNLGYKESMHKKAETEKKSCGSCHVAGGKAFESKGNCAKCHAKKTA